jgi:hypothetical protein
VILAILLADPGEWPSSAILLGVVFGVACTGVAGLGWWVIRGDRLNRRYQGEPEVETFRESPSPASESEIEAPAGVAVEDNS